MSRSPFIVALAIIGASACAGSPSRPSMSQSVTQGAVPSVPELQTSTPRRLIIPPPEMPGPAEPSPLPEPGPTPSPVPAPLPTPAPIPQAVACDPLFHQPAGYFVRWFDMGGTPLVGNVRLMNAGNWEVRLFAANSLAKYVAMTPDAIKSAVIVTTECGETADRVVSFSWKGDPFKFWWVEVWRDGLRQLISPVIENPYD